MERYLGILLKPRDRREGFTTIELALVLIISGFIFGALIFAYSLYMKQSALNTTNNSVQTVQAALDEFKNLNGFYPCPADPTIGPGNPNYGVEARTALNNYASACAVAIPSVNGADINGDGAAEKVRVGAVPFKTLLDPAATNPAGKPIVDTKLTADQTIDQWGSKISYAVTDRLSIPNASATQGYNDYAGAIDVRDENNATAMPTAGANGARLYAHYALISHGEDRSGGYSINGTLTPCPVIAPVPGQLNETTNCSNNLTGVILDGLHIETAGGKFDDDIVKYGVGKAPQLWKYTDATQTKIQNANNGNVGIGQPAPTQRLHVAGDIATKEMDAVQYCDVNGQNCTFADTIGGTGATPNSQKMQCPAGQVISAIEKNAVNDPANGIQHCVDAFPTSLAGQSCPAGQHMYGISNTKGLLCCVDGQACPPTAVTTCATGPIVNGVCTACPSDPTGAPETWNGSTCVANCADTQFRDPSLPIYGNGVCIVSVGCGATNNNNLNVGVPTIAGASGICGGDSYTATAPLSNIVHSTDGSIIQADYTCHGGYGPNSSGMVAGTKDVQCLYNMPACGSASGTCLDGATPSTPYVSANTDAQGHQLMQWDCRDNRGGDNTGCLAPVPASVYPLCDSAFNDGTATPSSLVWDSASQKCVAVSSLPMGCNGGYGNGLITDPASGSCVCPAGTQYQRRGDGLWTCM